MACYSLFCHRFLRGQRFLRLYRFYWTSKCRIRLELYRDLNDQWGIGLCSLGLGYAHQKLNLEQSREYYLDAVNLFEKTGYSRGMAEALEWTLVISALTEDLNMVEWAYSRFLALYDSPEYPIVRDAIHQINAVMAEAAGRYE